MQKKYIFEIENLNIENPESVRKNKNNNNFEIGEDKVARDKVQKSTEHLCIQNKLLYAHVSSVGKEIARDKDGYSVQLAE